MIRRRTPLRRRTRLRARGKTSYRRRPRDLDRMRWTRRQSCMVRTIPPDPNRITPCSGPVEADHMGERGLGAKAADATCVAMCRGHHRERTDHTGCFRDLTRDELRVWRADAIARTEAAWSAR